MNTDANFYLQYAVNLNSVIYDVYLESYDDMENHIRPNEEADKALRLRFVRNY